MALDDRITRALSVVLPAGSLGASAVLALSSAHAMPVDSSSTESQAQGAADVSERLSAIRAGVSELRSQMAPGSSEIQPDGSKLIPTWWGNGGWGRWHFGWGNHGFGWPNWHNWGNGWHNWNNGWNNGWHNYWHNT
jgi:rSAM-associated Gly-rich repeat protein